MLSTVMPAFGYPLINMFLIMFVNARERTESKLFVFWKRLMCARRVRKDDGMLALLVLSSATVFAARAQQSSEAELRLDTPSFVFAPYAMGAV